MRTYYPSNIDTILPRFTSVNDRLPPHLHQYWHSTHHSWSHCPCLFLPHCLCTKTVTRHCPIGCNNHTHTNAGLLSELVLHTHLAIAHCPAGETVRCRSTVRSWRYRPQPPTRDSALLIDAAPAAAVWVPLLTVAVTARSWTSGAALVSAPHSRLVWIRSCCPEARACDGVGPCGGKGRKAHVGHSRGSCPTQRAVLARSPRRELRLRSDATRRVATGGGGVGGGGGGTVRACAHCRGRGCRCAAAQAPAHRPAGRVSSPEGHWSASRRCPGKFAGQEGLQVSSPEWEGAQACTVWDWAWPLRGRGVAAGVGRCCSCCH